MRLKIQVSICLIGLLVFISLTENRYHFLLKNLLLAFIPLVLAWLIEKFSSKFICSILGIVWFLFYPNSIYMLTDFMHLSAIGTDLSTPHQYFHFTLLCFSIILGVWFGVMSFSIVSTKIMDIWQINWRSFQLTWVIVLSVLTAFAIYVGRFLRIHTITLFFDPVNTVRYMLLNLNQDAGIFILCFTMLHLLLIFCFRQTQMLRKDW